MAQTKKTEPPRVLDAVRVCPACSATVSGIVDEECAICNGSGILLLGPAALDIYDPPTVSRAVTLAFKETRDVASTITMLRDAGIVGSAPRPHT